MTGVERCEQYVSDVLKRKIPACQTIILACKRYRKDKRRKDLALDKKAANAAVANAERFKHAKGRWQGKPVELQNWQCFWFVNLFGWKWTATKKRRFRYCYAQVPRKNGKSFTAILAASIMFACDEEKGAEVYLGATSQDHAKDLLFDPAKYVIGNNPKFVKRFGVEINAASVIIPANFSVLKSVIRKPDDGYSPHCAVVDEYHKHDSDDQWAVFDTGMGAREQPLLLTVTTAGSNLGGPCKEMHEESKRILEDPSIGDTNFVLIYEPDEDDEWDDPAVFEKVNPNIDVIIDREYLLDQLAQARRSASKQSSYRTKHLNQWVGAKTVWMNQLAWQAQARKKLELEDFAGLPCYLTVDLNTKTDLAALGIVFRVDGEYTAFAKHYAPEDTIAENDKYRQFELDAALTSTPGNVTDYAFIEHDIELLAEQFDVLGLGYDPWQANYLATRLQEKGLEVFEYRHTVANMSEPMKELEALVLQKKYHHNGDPVFSWCMANVMARKDEKENIYPVKDNKDSPNKIDGAVAAIMGVGMWIKHGEDNSFIDTDFISSRVPS